MKVGILRETAAGECRVAVVPETVKKFVKRGVEVVVEAGAGALSGFSDRDYEEAGAKVAPSVDGADIVVRIQKPTADDIARLPEGRTLIGFLYPLSNPDVVRTLAARKGNAIAVDMIPRTTLAQSMDVLSSQANLAGYKAVLIAAEKLPKFFPMLMTAAGTITPAKVLILGAGVAGLQAIATARRLGAVVEVFDVRKVVKEQVESLGAKFVVVDDKEDAAGAGGYAKETSAEYQRKQQELIQQKLSQSDVCITTALIPGKRAPILVTESMRKVMRPGSVIVDLAAEQGGNVEGTVPGQTVVKDGVTIVGHPNLPSTMAVHASLLYSRNIEKLLTHLWNKDNTMKWDMNEEITKGCVIVKDGQVVHSKVQEVVK